MKRRSQPMKSWEGALTQGKEGKAVKHWNEFSVRETWVGRTWELNDAGLGKLWGGVGFIFGVMTGHCTGNVLICLWRKLNKRTARKTTEILVRKLLFVQEKGDRGLNEGGGNGNEERSSYLNPLCKYNQKDVLM